jgi:hypothetical protein
VLDHGHDLVPPPAGLKQAGQSTACAHDATGWPASRIIFVLDMFLGSQFDIGLEAKSGDGRP